MLTLILAIFILCGSLALAWEFRAMAREMKDLDGTDAASKSTRQRKDEEIRKEIEKWRSGQ